MNNNRIRTNYNNSQKRVFEINLWFIKISFYHLIHGDSIDKHWDKSLRKCLFIPVNDNPNVLFYNQKGNYERKYCWSLFDSRTTAIRVPIVKVGEKQTFIVVGLKNFKSNETKTH